MDRYFTMTFKEFIHLTEDGGGSEQGLMVNKPAKGRKPSDGHAFAQNLSAFSGGEGGSAGPAAGAAFMKKMVKKMKKRMKST